MQHFCEKHLDKIKAYMEKVSVRIPPPAKCTIEGLYWLTITLIVIFFFLMLFYPTFRKKSKKDSETTFCL